MFVVTGRDPNPLLLLFFAGLMGALGAIEAKRMWGSIGKRREE